MTEESPEGTRWLIPPNLPPGMQLDLNAIVREQGFTPEVTDQLAKLLVAARSAAPFEVAVCPPRCIQQAECPELKICTDNSMSCPHLESCTRNHPQ